MSNRVRAGESLVADRPDESPGSTVATPNRQHSVSTRAKALIGAGLLGTAGFVYALWPDGGSAPQGSETTIGTTAEPGAGDIRTNPSPIGSVAASAAVPPPVQQSRTPSPTETVPPEAYRKLDCRAQVDQVGNVWKISVFEQRGTEMPPGAHILILGTAQDGTPSYLVAQNAGTEATYKPAHHDGNANSPSILFGVTAAVPPGSTPDQPGWMKVSDEVNMGGFGPYSQGCA